METTMNLVGNHEEDSEMMDSFFQGNPIDWNLDDIGLDPIIDPPLPISHDLSSLLHNAEPCAENVGQYLDPQPPSTSSSSDQMIPKSEFQGANQQQNFNGGFNFNGYYMKK
ncbi:PREDICTED: uncharacterized protein LOC104827083 [Tarenaya hassleriana]|uniref:uncharacterized protein LOC104827083 n=1 Tax=Tarenaya hassleriana TaxID=28532 RepID=UPI00053C9621|nr:PREDICTED: uncharacterized protein LOC104827083 [Tarenaya hassleriana]